MKAKIVLYFDGSDSYKEIALRYISYFFPNDDTVCLVGIDGKTINNLFPFLKQRHIDPKLCEFHFILEKKQAALYPFLPMIHQWTDGITYLIQKVSFLEFGNLAS